MSFIKYYLKILKPPLSALAPPHLTPQALINRSKAEKRRHNENGSVTPARDVALRQMKHSQAKRESCAMMPSSKPTITLSS